MDAYLLAAAIVYSLSCFSLAAWAYTGWLKDWRRVDFFWVYAVVLALAATLGMAVFGISPFINADWLTTLLCIPLGLLLGVAATAADRAIARRMTRSRILGRRTASGRGRDGAGHLDPAARIAAVRPITGSSTALRSTQGQAVHHIDVQSLQWRFAPLMLVGVLEEVVYRGTLVQASLMLVSPTAIVVALAASLVAFSLSHIQYGWIHVCAKTPLGLLCLSSVLMFDTLVAALVAHVVFNANACWDVRRAAPKPQPLTVGVSQGRGR